MNGDLPLSSVNDLPLKLLSSRLAVARLAAEAEHPDWARSSELLAVVRTREELSIVCDERYVPPEVKAERGWRAFKVEGPLEFSLVGVMAGLATTLAQAGVSLFALSTFDTDYILVKESLLERARLALQKAGYILSDG